MRLACSPVLCPDYPVDRFVDLADAAGYRRLELLRDRTQSTPVHDDFSVPGVREILARRDASVAVFQIRRLTGRKADSDERNLAYNLRQLEWDVHLGRALGVERFAVSGGERTDEARCDLIDGLTQLCERVPDASFALTNLAASPVRGLEDLEELLPQLPDGVGVCLDTGELLAAGEDIVACAEALSSSLDAVRLQDTDHGRPAALGCGDLPLEELLLLLQRGGFAGDLVVCLDGIDARDAERRQAASAAHGLLTALIQKLPD